MFLYGELARRAHARRAAARRAGRLARADRARRARPTSARAGLHPTAGAVLVAARPPLVAFNVELAPPATLDDARAIAALIREGGAEGLPGVRAIGLWLDAARRRPGLDQRRGPPTRPRSPTSSRRSRATRAVAGAELVGLAPRAAFDGFPDDVPRATTGGTDRGRSLARRHDAH